MIYRAVGRSEKLVWGRGDAVQGVTHLHKNHKHGFHHHGLWLEYLQGEDFRVSRGLPTVPPTPISNNIVFSKSQNVCKAVIRGHLMKQIPMKQSFLLKGLSYIDFKITINFSQP